MNTEGDLPVRRNLGRDELGRTWGLLREGGAREHQYCGDSSHRFPFQLLNKYRTMTASHHSELRLPYLNVFSPALPCRSNPT